MNRHVRQSERIGIFVDFANIDRSLRDAGHEVDYEKILEYLVAGRHLVEAIAYVPVDPRAPSSMDRSIEDLWLNGYFVKSKLGKSTDDGFKCNVDVEMTIDMLNAALDMNVDTILIVSGDGDFLPVLEYLRGRGVRVEVCGIHATVARELVLKCSGFVDMEAYFENSNESI